MKKIVIGFIFAVILSKCTIEKKVFYVNSYHQGYPPSDEVYLAIQKSFASEPKIHLKSYFIDSKRNPSEEKIKQNVGIAMQQLQDFNPDLVIASDDDAVKFLVVPYLKGTKTPVVFCGVNWSAKQYGLPAANVAGILEVLPLKETLIQIKKYYPSTRKIMILSENSTSELNNKQLLDTLFQSAHFIPNYHLVNNYEEWKIGFIKGNRECDLIYLPTNGAIKNWGKDDAIYFVKKNIKVPVITCDDFMMPYCVFGLTKVAGEQGEWAAQTALAVLNGKEIDKIGLTQNHSYRCWINADLANRIGFKWSENLKCNLY